MVEPHLTRGSSHPLVVIVCSGASRVTSPLCDNSAILSPHSTKFSFNLQVSQIPTHCHHAWTRVDSLLWILLGPLHTRD